MIASSSQSILGQMLLPLQGVVDFFSPPVPAASFASKVIGAQPRLAKAPVLPSNPRPANAQQKIQPAGIRMVGQDLMGSMTAAQILRSRRAQDGRIVISGRMRDVCAELDRLCDEPA
jgi:hypothetical protein